MFDFLKVSKDKKKPVRPRPVSAPKKAESKGTVKIDKFVFNVREINDKGFILDPYDKDIVISGQRFRFEINAVYNDKPIQGRAEAVVTKVVDNALAAAFVTKFF
ncbi:hypothetical protein T8K17_17385 [Thalassobaculum sp. OXR-137]|uniref:hypothetical protein n=1 Tax=Thalassobaculum sp. OXR-137 TaxID=3100173 RepID=UPI002AC8970C|nr:hypothetical protein [Thalassobaculum sp. OXR-137]WPZ33007.1 hypothetical protein T8K17_17385 [Thalassobaculum sp. OXR-137]